MSSCPICCETFTAAKRKEIQCPYCHVSACVECCQKFILDSANADASCMSCRALWNREFLDLTFTKAFIGREYRAHRERVLFEREYAMLPASQFMVEHWKRAQDLRGEIPGMTARIAALKIELETLTNQKTRANNELRVIEMHEYRRGLRNGDSSSERRQFVKACPAEACRGFLSTAWKCGTCNVRVCPDCHVIKEDDEHVCKPDDVATATLLRKDTKGCPSCATMITKIDGCDQMWCTQCHTAFSWRTGAIETSVVHNPHFYEWQRRQNGGVAPRVPGDNGGCGNAGLMPIYLMETHPVFKKEHHDIKQFMRRTHRLLTHTEAVTIQAYRNRREDNADLRLYYLVGAITEKDWKQKLHQREKKAIRNDATRQVIEAFVEVGKILFGDFLMERASGSDVVGQIEKLIDYTNENITALEKRFSVKIEKLTTRFV
jgi:hypothetical protein